MRVFAKNNFFATEPKFCNPHFGSKRSLVKDGRIHTITAAYYVIYNEKLRMLN